MTSGGWLFAPMEGSAWTAADLAILTAGNWLFDANAPRSHGYRPAPPFTFGPIMFSLMFWVYLMRDVLAPFSAPVLHGGPLPGFSVAFGFVLDRLPRGLLDAALLAGVSMLFMFVPSLLHNFMELTHIWAPWAGLISVTLAAAGIHMWAGQQNFWVGLTLIWLTNLVLLDGAMRRVNRQLLKFSVYALRETYGVAVVLPRPKLSRRGIWFVLLIGPALGILAHELDVRSDVTSPALLAIGVMVLAAVTDAIAGGLHDLWEATQEDDR